MKLKEFINQKHDTDRIVKSALEIRKRITKCVTEEQRETARNYVDNWKRMTFYQENLNLYKGFAKLLCVLLGIEEHQKCIHQIECLHKMLITTINDNIQ